jgi:pimeloyl-ACP methyl ester carboxylesterase
VLHAVRIGVAGVLSDAPAVLARQVRQQPEHEPACPAPGLDPGEPARHPIQQPVGLSLPAGLAGVEQPVLVVNGDDDAMLPTINSFHLAELLPNAQLSIYPDSGHGAPFQYHDLFVQQVRSFLRD